MQQRAFRLGSLVGLLAVLALPLAACDSTTDEGAACVTGAECVVGQACVGGVCVAAAGQPGAAGFNGVGGGAGAATTGGAGGVVGASGNTTGGVTSSAGSGGVTSVAGSGGASTGGVSTGGSGGSGQAGSGNTSGAGGSGGSGGVVDPGPTVGECKNDFWPAANNGSVTRYDFKQGTQLPACTYVITHTGNGSDGDWDTVEGISTGDGGYFGAMNTEDYAQGAACGACVEASYQGRKVVLTIVDECPKSSNPLCNKGHIDLSRKAIRQLQPDSNLENLTGVSWHYVKCPATGNVKARIHPNQTEYWTPVVIENGLFPMKSVTINGVAAKRVGNSTGGNAWEASGSKLPYLVHATDVNGNAISFNVSAGKDLKDTGKQFMCK